MANQPEQEQLGQSAASRSVSYLVQHLDAHRHPESTNDSLNKDIKLALSSLSFDHESSTTPVGDGPVILKSPLRHTASDDYLGSNAKHLIVHAGDEVLVFAWADKGKTAIAYNPECGRVGWVAANVLKENDGQNEGRPVIWVAIRKHPDYTKAAGVEDGNLTWDRGHYILTCKVNNKPNHMFEGVGINLATGEFGAFKQVWDEIFEKVRQWEDRN
ncbi:hypothetical protein LTR10_014867 [Elasticomyces elasticus]|uniref:SH3 domain-containing protein n=1 Tax=Exophiala sideris TaxID=1016849 RepID=A0ABR0JG21_9EURO|nr:hypothetical protein LTR10_014867 [Elasticomyces elasticus]KAK5025711.1 hypothetical protein LTS07_007915 [Exophiala sideris]KAK5033080.1 hypothetical protein LTR13_007045 [Exophiala sideris]KAK5063565.1 hypothetical protein LTR69_004271 [Exophiala sideris]KAK5180602.1 hypothetical protein LTR44_006916 [Eurotiomycetes sp. CCFEE 6388]